VDGSPGSRTKQEVNVSLTQIGFEEVLQSGLTRPPIAGRCQRLRAGKWQLGQIHPAMETSFTSNTNVKAWLTLPLLPSGWSHCSLETARAKRTKSKLNVEETLR